MHVCFAYEGPVRKKNSCDYQLIMVQILFGLLSHKNQARDIEKLIPLSVQLTPLKNDVTMNLLSLDSLHSTISSLTMLGLAMEVPNHSGKFHPV